MILQYTLRKNDYLEYYLYSASIEKVGKQIWRSTIISAAGFLPFALVLYWEGVYLMSGIVVAVSIGILLFSPGYSKANLRGTYHRIINKQLRHEKEPNITLTFGESGIDYSSLMSRIEIYYIAFETIEDAPEHFFIFLKNGHGIIIPKIEIDVDVIRTYLQSLSQKLSIPFNNELNWKWK